jgi:hypothetical protein
MSPLEAAVLIGLLVLPLHCLVQWQLSRQEDPAYLRTQGIVVVRESALDAHSEAIGEYAGRCIWGSVTFKGMHYRFSRVTRPGNREKTGPGELWLEPGLVYVAA